MSVINSLMIPCVESQYTQEYIANVLWSQHIAKVSSITLIPYIKNSEIYSIAYIAIAEWCDTEAAYNFITRLKNPNREARIVHHSDDWWAVHLNNHNDGNLNVGSYTVDFASDYFQRDIQCDDQVTAPCTDDEEEYICDEEEWQEFLEKRPIKGLGNDYYTVEEALEHLWVLNGMFSRVEQENPVPKKFYELLNEINHFESELRIHEAVNKSSNVTQRALDFGKRKFEEESFPFHLCAVDTPKRDVAFGFGFDTNMSNVIGSANSKREVARNCDEMFA